MKFKQGIAELQRQVKLNPDTDINELARNVGEQMNNLYGGINRDRKHRSKTAQALFGLVTFAPDWTETNFVNFFKATHFDFSKASAEDQEGFFNKAAEYVKSGYKGVTPEEHKMYMKMWANVALRAAFITTAFNLLMAFFNDPDHEEEYWQTVERMFKESFSNPLRLNWMALNITPIRNKFVPDDGKQHYLDILGPFADAVKMIAEPILLIKNKSSVLGKIIIDAATGSNWQGKKYTSLSELTGSDDKGLYSTSNKKTGVRVGDPKGGKHKGQLVRWAAPGETNALSWEQMPSFMLETMRGSIPIIAQNALTYIEGETDGWQTLTTGLGIKMNSAKPAALDYNKQAEEIIRNAKIYQAAIADKENNNENTGQLYTSPVYNAVDEIVDPYSRKKTGWMQQRNELKKQLEDATLRSDETAIEEYTKQLNDMNKMIVDKFKDVEFPTKYR